MTSRSRTKKLLSLVPNNYTITDTDTAAAVNNNVEVVLDNDLLLGNHSEKPPFIFNAPYYDIGTESVVDLVVNDNNEVVLDNDLVLGNHPEEPPFIFNAPYYDIGTESVVDLVVNDNNEVVLDNDLVLGNHSEQPPFIFNASCNDIGTESVVDLVVNDNNEVVLDNDLVLGNHPEEPPFIFNAPYYDIDLEASSSTNNTEEDLLNITYDVNLQESDTVELPESFLRKRKKRGKPQHWNKNFQKTKRLKGKEYFGKKKIDGVWKYNVHKSAKSLKNPCNCVLQTKKNCIVNCKEVTETQRNNIFKSFWAIINNEARIQFLKNNMKILPTARKRGLCSTKRNSSVQYYLNNIRVCKTMFLNTFDIGENMIKKIINKSHSETEFSGEDNTEDNNLESTSTTIIIHQSISDRKLLLNTFFELLPKLESHYCRASTSKLYLEPNWLTKRSLYNFYCNDFCVSHNTTPMSDAMFYTTLEEKNISLFKPKKDACDLCTAYETGNVSIDQKQLHDQMKFEARQEKETDKESENEVFTMDLQSVLLCPKSNVSSQYYKTKLIVHNFTVYDLKRKNGYCYLWNETEGGLTAHEFSSIIVHFLQKFVIDTAKVQNVKIILYSDGCTYQNRNATLSNALLNLSLLSGITIIQKYLLRGHTQMEVDSMHSTIERKIRHKKINIPADYVTACKTACIKNPYYVEYLSFNFFKSFSKIMFFKSIRPGNKKGDPVVTEIKALMYEANKNVSYKLKFSDDWSNLLLSRNSSTQTPLSIETLPPLHTHRINIKKEKYEHLQQLKASMEKDYHSFYDNLPKE